MMKRVIAILLAIMLCMTLIACSNQSTTLPSSDEGKSITSDIGNATSGTEKNDDGKETDHSTEPTESQIISTTPVTEGNSTSEKEDDEVNPTETSTPKKETEKTDYSKGAEDTAPPKETEETKPVEETTSATEPPQNEKPKDDIKPEEKDENIEPPSTRDIEILVAQYINQYRGNPATVFTGLTEVARYRARQLVTDFSHNSNPNPCTALQYGEYIDMTLFGGDASESYYRGYNREAIGKGDWFGTADQMAQRIATGFKNSKSHWAYVGDSEYSYMAVGVIYNETDDKWYCCICMSSKNYGD